MLFPKEREMKFRFTTIGLISEIVKGQKAKKAVDDVPEELRETPCAYIDALEDYSFSTFSSGYNAYLLDTYAGGGWLPRFNYPVRPLPYPINLDKFLIPTEAKEIFNDEFVGGFLSNLINSQAQLNKFQKASLEVNYNLFNQWKDKKYAYHLDLSEYLTFTILSDGENVTARQMEFFWSSLTTLQNPVIFEIITDGRTDKIVYQFLCHEEDKTLVVNSLSSLFPNVNTNGNDEDYLRNRIEKLEEWVENYNSVGVHLGLRGHHSNLLKTFSNFDTDPLNTIAGLTCSVLDNKPKENYGTVLQMIIQPSNGIWENHLRRIEMADKSLSPDLEYRDLNDKLKYPLFGVVLRMMFFVKGDVGDEEIEKSHKSFVTAGQSFSIFKDQQEGNYPDVVNIFDNIRQKPKIFGGTDGYLDSHEILSMITGNTYRMGFILNSQELTGLAHFPTKSFNHPKLLRQDTTRVKAPESVTAGDGLLIGVNEIFGQSQKVYVPEDFRFRHVYVVGKTGTGKTTLLLNMIKSDIDAGKGVGLIDPHGDLVERVLQVIPENRIDDVILFDPTDYEHPIGFNMFQVSDRAEERQMRSDIVVAIRRLFESSSWGDNIDHLFRTSVATLIADQSQKHTILDLRKLISDDVYRSQVLARLNDDYLKEFWVDDFPGFAQSTVSAVKRRLASVLGEPEVRNVLGQSQNSFSFKDMMDKKKIFLANLSRGILGENISGLFGGLLVSKIQLTAMARASQPEEKRVPFYLYVDEFQNFVNESFEVILSEARKYKLCLTITHQFTGQLPSRLYDAVFGNIGSLIVFEVGVDDATALEKQLGKFSREDILNLERFHTFTRIGKAMDTFSMRTFPDPTAEKDFSSRIRQASREKYCSKQETQPVTEEQVENDKTAGIDDFFERDK